MTIFHRKTAGKPASSHSTAEKKPQPVTGPRSLTVKFPKNGQDVKIQLVDASGKQLVQSVAELMRLVGLHLIFFCLTVLCICLIHHFFRQGSRCPRLERISGSSFLQEGGQGRTPLQIYGTSARFRRWRGLRGVEILASSFIA